MDLSDQELLQLLNTAHGSLEKVCKLAQAKNLDLPDAQVLQLLKTAGEARKTALVLWAKRYQDELLGACVYVLKYSETEAKSVVLEALRKAVYSEIDQKKEIKNVGHWLFTIAQNVDRDKARKDRRTQSQQRRYVESRHTEPAPQSTMTPEERFAREELILKNLHKLTLPEREILFLYVIQGYSYQVIMDRLDIEYDAARARVSRAYQKLKKVSAEDV